MCEFHNSKSNGLGDIWWTDKCSYFSSIDIPSNNVKKYASNTVVLVRRSMGVALYRGRWHQQL